MNSVGIDLHRRRSHIAAIDDEGTEVISRRIQNDPATFLELLADLDGESRVALEATYGWEWLADLIEEAGYELHLAHPSRTKAIAAARVKTDAVDARTLAQLLRADPLPAAYIAPRELRDLRELLRHRVALTQIRSGLKDRVHAILAKQGIQRARTDLFGRAGREFLAELKLREPPRRRLDSLLCLIGDFDREIAATTQGIDARARRDDRVPLLCQIRGVGLHGDAGHRRGRRDRAFCDRAQAMRLGRPDADRQKLRRQGEAGANLAHGITHPALGAGRGGPEIGPRRRPATPDLRAHRQTQRAQCRQGRRREAHPHPQLLRLARRRDPLPWLRPCARGYCHGGLIMSAAAGLIAPPRPGTTKRTLGRAR
jgi:Transposase